MKSTQMGLLFLYILVVPQAFGFDQSHSIYGQFLKKSFTSTAKNPLFSFQKGYPERHTLALALKQMEKVIPSEWDSFSKNDQIAFMVNLYNASIITRIYHYYSPKNRLRSLKSLGSFLQTPWEKSTLTFCQKKISLKALESQIKDISQNPKIAFALFRAIKHSPDLPPVPLTGASLDTQLEFLAQHFLKDPEKTKIITQTHTITTLGIPSFLKDYDALFKIHDGSLENFIQARMGNRLEKIKTQWLNVDWSIPGMEETTVTVKEPHEHHTNPL